MPQGRIGRPSDDYKSTVLPLNYRGIFGTDTRSRTPIKGLEDPCTIHCTISVCMEEDKRLELLHLLRLLVVFKTTSLPIRINLPSGRSGGIRTHGTFLYAGFLDQ